MKKGFSLFLSLAIVLVLAVPLIAGDLATKGKAWLDPHTEAAAINVNGEWHETEWGLVVLNQAQGSRDVTGRGDGWDITGIVSGNQVFLLFSNKDKVNYSATLTADGDKSLKGSYAKGFMNGTTKTRPMHLIKP